MTVADDAVTNQNGVSGRILSSSCAKAMPEMPDMAASRLKYSGSEADACS